MKWGTAIFWSMLMAATFFRIWSTSGIDRPDIGSCLKQRVHGTAVILEEPERKENGQMFVVRATELLTEKGQKCTEDLLLRMKTELYPRLSYGDTITLKGNLSKPYNFRSDDGREFNYEGFLAKDNVFYEIKSAEVEKMSSKTGFSIQSALYKLKRNFVLHLEKALGDPHAALAAGLVVGEKSALGNDLLNDFRTVGLIHIIVLSGYNITIVADSMRKILSFLPRVWGIVIGGIGVIIFGILVGGGATVVRSCLMAVVALFGEAIRRDYNVVRGLLLVGLLMLIQNPLILFYDPSFQLSFLATLGLILLAGPIESKISFITERFGMRGIVASTLATQIFIAPFILHMMGILSIVGMIVNILVLPLVPLTMLSVFLTGTLGFIIPSVSTFMGWITHILLSYELFIVEVFTRIPFASVHLPQFSGWFVVGFYAIFAMVYAIIALNPSLKRSSKNAS